MVVLNLRVRVGPVKGDAREARSGHARDASHVCVFACRGERADVQEKHVTSAVNCKDR
jgi:hypothetical protein